MLGNGLKIPRTQNALVPICGLAVCTATAVLAPSRVEAQATSYALPERYTFDKLGIDIGSQMYERRDMLLSIGDSNGGLSWTFMSHGDDPYSGTIAYWGSPASAGQHVQVKLAGALTQFVGCETNNCQNWSGTGSTLVNSGSNWLYTAEDGSVYTFDATGSISSYNAFSTPIVLLGKLLSIKKPSGELISINYAPSSFAINSVVSSRGFAIRHETGGKISAINLANHTCDATAMTCDGVDSYITLTSANSILTITDIAGRNWQYMVSSIDSYQDPLNPIDWSQRDGLTYFKSPDGYQVSLTYDTAGRLTQFTDNRGTWTYSYPDETLYLAQHGSTQHTINVTDPSGALLYTAHSAQGIVDYVRDPLGNKTQYEINYNQSYQGNGYVRYTQLKSITEPEGNIRSWSYDARGNITGVTDTPKPGSGLTAVGISAVYPTTCANAFTCNKPTSTTDANGNVTNYTYDSAHGGVLSEMQPAPTSGAARPLKLTTWVQKTPYYRNASGTLVASSTPIWVINTETQCQTVAGSNSPVCDNAAPKRVSTYQYGADGTANNLRVRGVAVAADGTTRRTCYGYDGVGNRISETSPRAGLSTCP